MIGLVGCHRVGKTTLARALHDVSGIPLLETSTSGVFKALGKSPSADYPVAERLFIQEAILDSLVGQLEAATREEGVYVTDRTPMDLATYMLTDVSRDGLKPDLARKVVDYVERCKAETARFLSMVVLIQPGIPFVPAEGKGGACEAYQEHFTAVARGLLPQLPIRFSVLPRDVLELSDRIEATRVFMDHAMRDAVVAAVQRDKAGIVSH